ncbi:hypothetical protein HDZ31DRAFT_60089 [Schizophyllum fasciatum]
MSSLSESESSAPLHPDAQPLPPRESKRVPLWLPISLIAFSGAAIATPLLFLRWQRKAALTESLNKISVSEAGQLANAPTAHPSVKPKSLLSAFIVDQKELDAAAASAPPSSSGPAFSSSFRSNHDPFDDDDDLRGPPPPPDPNFNAALYTAKAFGLATALVVAGAFATIQGAMYYFDVDDARQFGRRMRLLILEKMPALAAQIHRAPDDSPPEATASAASDVEQDWNWEDAEARLRRAFETRGFAGWAEAAAKEVEVEDKLQRKKQQELVERLRPSS